MTLSGLSIPPWAKLAAVGLVLAACFGAGWEVNGWREASALSDYKSKIDGEKAAAVTEALRTQKERFDKERNDQDKIAAIDKAELTKLRGTLDENDRLRECLRTGTCGLRIAAKCPTSRPSDVPSASPSTGVDSGATAQLDESAQRAYLALRAGIATASDQLAACQAAVKTLTGQ